MTLTAAAQKGSEHPLARAVLAKAERLVLPALKDFGSHAGMGLTAIVDARRIAIGNRRLMRENGIETDVMEAQAARLEEQAHR